MEFKAVGDTVNLASRLESMAEPGHIFISEATYLHLLRDDPALIQIALGQAVEQRYMRIYLGFEPLTLAWHTRAFDIERVC